MGVIYLEKSMSRFNDFVGKNYEQQDKINDVSLFIESVGRHHGQPEQ
jgi:hypothetical protein